VERTGVANAASGKSGGFLAYDWSDGTPLQALARRSFDLHAKLADALDGDWGYRRMTAYGGFASALDVLGSEANRHPVDWLADDIVVYRHLGSTKTTAQVHPALYTQSLMRAAEEHGAEVRIGAVTGVTQANGAATGVEVDGEALEADAVVVTMGPWSVLSAEWLPLPPVFGLKGHSIVFETGSKLPADALFLEYQEAGGQVHSPEVFPRPDGTTYICGISTETPLPADPAGVAADPGALDLLEEMCRKLSPVLAEAKVLARQACFRPITQDGLPLIGGVPGVANAYVATGHSVWGILNAPATGEALSELILDGAAESVSLDPFDPGRLKPQRHAARPVSRL
jgi:glycine/D-amino acid oxidase-like deaminating enzyme